jgi:hypothetical protein
MWSDIFTSIKSPKKLKIKDVDNSGNWTVFVTSILYMNCMLFTSSELKQGIIPRFFGRSNFGEHPNSSVITSNNLASTPNTRGGTIQVEGNESFDILEVKKTHKNSTINRIKESVKESAPIVLAVQDTMTINYNTHKKTEGIGYCCDNTLGINVHSCISVTTEGIVLGVLDQSAITRPKNKDFTPDEEKKRRPIIEKESNR